MRMLPAIAVLLVALAAGSSAGAADQPSTVVIDDRLDPAALSVPVGGSITWRNAHAERHRMRSTHGPDDFDTGNLEPGETASVTLELPGEYRYVDARDADEAAYWGTVTVTAADRPAGRASGAPGDEEPGSTSAAASAGDGQGPISMADESFAPASVTVPLGATLTWLNDDDDEHTVTAGDGAFDSGELQPGGSFAHTFEQPGTFDYVCLLHSGMRGTVVVEDGAAGGSADGAAPAPPSGDSTDPSPAPTAAATGSPTRTPAAGQSGAEVEVRDFAFDPDRLEVPAGTTVTWRQAGEAPHTVTADDDAFDSGILDTGASFEHTFAEPGTYRYVCTLHPEMVADVTVVEASGSPPVEPDAGPTPGAEAPSETASPAVGQDAPPTDASDPDEGQDLTAATAATGTPGVPLTGLLLVAALLSASILVGAWRVERALRAGAVPTSSPSRDVPPPARRPPGRA